MRHHCLRWLAVTPATIIPGACAYPAHTLDALQKARRRLLAYLDNKCDRASARELAISERAYWRWRTRLGLPARGPRGQRKIHAPRAGTIEALALLAKVEAEFRRRNVADLAVGLKAARTAGRP